MMLESLTQQIAEWLEKNRAQELLIGGADLKYLLGSLEWLIAGRIPDLGQYQARNSGFLKIQWQLHGAVVTCSATSSNRKRQSMIHFGGTA